MQIYHCKEHVKLTLPNREWNDLAAALQQQLIDGATRHESYPLWHTLYYRPSTWTFVRALIPERRRWSKPRRHSV